MVVQPGVGAPTEVAVLPRPRPSTAGVKAINAAAVKGGRVGAAYPGPAAVGRPTRAVGVLIAAPQEAPRAPLRLDGPALMAVALSAVKVGVTALSVAISSTRPIRATAGHATTLIAPLAPAVEALLAAPPVVPVSSAIAESSHATSAALTGDVSTLAVVVAALVVPFKAKAPALPAQVHRHQV